MVRSMVLAEEPPSLVGSIRRTGPYSGEYECSSDIVVHMLVIN